MKLSNIFSMAAVALGAAAALTACSDDCPDYWGEFHGPLKPKPAYIWVDASANAPYLVNSQENIAAYIGQAKAAGFTDVVVDVRGTDGDVLFKTDLVDQATTYYAWDGTPTQRTATWDYLQAFIDAGHAAGVRVHAAMNTMVGGNVPRGTQGRGMLFRDASKHDWCNVLNTAGGLVNQLDMPLTSGELFLNPHHPEVQEFIVGLVADLAKYKDLDGIVLDRGRFKDLSSDFSDLTRAKFEQEIGTTLTNWPGDVMPAGASAVPTDNFPPYYQQWWKFRAQTMHDIVAAASEKAHQVNPAIQFSCYVGAWYASYYQCGVNWASPKYDPASVESYQKSWASSDYLKTGYADKIDMLILGCYARPNYVYGNTEWTVQGFASLGYAKVMGACTVIGGPDIGNNWPTAARDYVEAGSDKTKEYYLQQAANTVPACMGVCDGYFMFDICHLQSSPEYWDAIAAGFQKYLDSDDDYGRQGEN